jgi:uncharacterized repeat protein (TIGR02543 family)
VQVSFDPSSTGAKSASLRVSSDDSSEPTVDVSLSGTGLDQEITVSPLTLAFGSQDVDDGATISQTVVITNDGTANLAISGVSLIGSGASHFVIENDTGEATLTPGSTRTVQVSFDPSSTGAKSASLRISSDDSSEPTVDVSLSGTGLDQEITVSPLTLAFGSQDIDAGATISQTVVITNDGTANLEISSVSLDGAGSSHFTIETDTGEATLTPGSTRTVQVSFDPSTIGAKAADLRILSDDSDEGTVDVALSGTGLDGGAPIPTVDFASSSYSVGENAGPAVITVTLSAASSLTVTVDYNSTNGTAISGDDYITASGTLTFNPGITSQTFAVTISDDGFDETNETVTLNLSNVNNGTIGGNDPATLTITDDDPTPTVDFNNAGQSAAENVGSMILIVQLDAVSGLTVTVPYSLSGTATEGAGADFTVTPSPAIIPAGSPSTLIFITVNDDSLNEDPETVVVTMGVPINGTKGITTVHTATITDNDPLPVVGFSSGGYGVNEADATATITVTLSPASGRLAAVDYATSDGTATAGSDYTAISGTLTFTPGQASLSFTVPVTDDGAPEAVETLNLDLSSAANATISGTNPVTLSIVDNDLTLTQYVSGSGSAGVTPDQPTYTDGQLVTLTATADPGWTFVGWTGHLSGSSTPVTLTMTESKVVTATFTQVAYILTTTTIGSGSVITNPVQATYTYGQIVTLTAVADPDWSFTGWSGDLSGNTNPVTVTMTGNLSATANFSAGGNSEVFLPLVIK